MSEATFVQEVVRSVCGAGAYNGADKAPPAAILWPDPEQQWRPLMPFIGAALRVLTLGPYDEAAGSGPGIWIRWRLRQLTVGDDDQVPIVYLPGVDRASVRGIEASADAVRPLADLQFRSSWWQQSNGTAWTPLAFARSADGADLDVAGDTATREAFASALTTIATLPLQQVRRSGRLQAVSLNAMVLGDPVKTLLQWINSDDLSALSAEERSALRKTCKSQYGFDPQVDGVITAAQLLADRMGNWAVVWERFADAPLAYPGVPERLRQAASAGKFFLQPDTSPTENERLEGEVRAALSALSNATSKAAREEILRLEAEHAERRTWVWAKLGKAPLAVALEPLSRIAAMSAKQAVADGVEDFVFWYASAGVDADDALLTAIAAVPNPADRAAVETALRAVYIQWADGNARRFQEALQADQPGLAPVATLPGDCVLFVDGLRLDVGRRLTASLRSASIEVEDSTRFAAVPSMTSSGKPAVAPLKLVLEGGDDFYPAYNGKKMDSAGLKQSLKSENVQLLAEDDTGDPTGRAWTEAADLDALGHKVGLKLADRVDQEVAIIAARVRELLTAGWTRVQVVTDHGWLLLPGGLPKIDFDVHKTDIKKSRCAQLMGSTGQVDQPTFTWSWDPQIRVAVPWGIAAFQAGQIYDHGGVSPQETITPHLIATRGGDASATAISGATWRGMRCRVTVDGAPAGSTIDIRRNPDSADTSIVTPKAASGGNEVTLLVEDDSRIGEPAFLVVLDASGKLLAQRETTIADA